MSSAARARLPEHRIGRRYRVERALGRGAMGTVYAVLDEGTGRCVALKQLGGARARVTDEGDRVRFRREFHSLARLRHPAIVEAYEFGVDESGLYYTMELLDGSDLRGAGTMEPARVYTLLRDIASALAFLHARNLVHRDLSPGNVRRTEDGRAKLIDFGVLATVGVSGEVAGTIPFVAPEAVRGLPLDHRSDLFGLGALAYYLLTQQHAFRAKNMAQLDDAWKTRPPPPSALAPAISAAADELVVSLLSVDPLARPSSAAEVVDRLGALAGLEPAREDETARAYLASAALVGREHEIAQIRRIVRKASQGRGRTIAIEAESGIGKTTLLRELGLEAQLAGATVCSVGSEAAGRGAYGVVHALAKALVAQAPEDAIAAARAHDRAICGIVPELAAQLGSVPTAEVSLDPAEQRLRVQAHLVSWIFEVASRRALVLLVDDIQRADEASAALLCAIAAEAHAHNLVLAVALRTDEPPRAGETVAAIVQSAVRLRLRGLGSKQVAELASALFGVVPNLDRLAAWMQEVGEGSPLHCTELARQLVERGVVRYVDGVWVVPPSVTLERLPERLSDAMDARIDRLGHDALALAEILAVYGASVSIDLCVALARPMDEKAVFDAIDELEVQEVLIGSGESYRFRHDGLREAVLRRVDGDAKRELHRTIGRTLASRGAIAPEDEAEIGWHFYRGGDTDAGAQLLERAARRLYEAQSFSDALAPLEVAIDWSERRNGTPSLELRYMTVVCAVLTDRKVALRYGADTVEIYRQHAGVALAAKLARRLGKHVALFAALGWATARWIVRGRKKSPMSPFAAMRKFFVVVGYMASFFALTGDVDELRKLVAALEPIAIFRKRVPYSIYLFTRSLLAFALGRWGQVRRDATRLLEILQTDRVTPISEMDRKQGEATARYTLTMVHAFHQEPELYAAQLRAMEALGLRYFELQAENSRLVYHRNRGEDELARLAEARVEALAVRLGSLWNIRAQSARIGACTCALVRDVLGLKRHIEQLESMVAQGFRFEAILDITRGEYQRERGELDAAQKSLECALGALDPEEASYRQVALVALAETFLARGDAARAAEHAERAIAIGRDPELGHVVYRLRADRCFALARAAAGAIEDAGRHLDAAIEDASRFDNPLVSGMLHEGRARVALIADERATFLHHLGEAETHWQSARNITLSSHVQRLAVQGQRARTSGDSEEIAHEAVTQIDKASGGETRSLLSACRNPAERATRALGLLVASVGGRTGWLYVLGEQGLRLAAPESGDEPPDAIARALAAFVERGSEARDETLSFADVAKGPGRWMPVLLRFGGWDGAIVGAVAIETDGDTSREPEGSLVDRLARELHASGDALARHDFGTTGPTSGEVNA